MVSGKRLLVGGRAGESVNGRRRVTKEKCELCAIVGRNDWGTIRCEQAAWGRTPTFVSDTYQHCNANPLRELQGGIACEKAVPQKECVRNSKLSREEET